MAKKLNSVLGIDIGAQNIKIAEIRSQGREAAVTALGMIATPEGAVDHTGVYNSDAVAAALKQCIADCGATVPNAIVSISGQASVLVRTLEVPRMNPTELKEHMQWEINRNIPFAESTVVSDFRPLQDTDPNSPNMDVVMAISPQSAIDTITECVKRAGKQLAAIDVEPMALARSVQFSFGDVFPNETICIVDMGHKTTSIDIYQNGKLLMPRQVPLGGEMLTKAIADTMTVSLQEAEGLKRTKASIPEAAADMLGASPVAFGVPGATQDFTPYNPFGEDGPAPPPVMVEETPASAPEAAAPAPYNPFAEDPAAPAPEETVAMAPPFEEVPIVAEPVVEDDSGRIYNAMAPVLEEFVAEVRRSVDYFRSRGGEVNRILLAGGGTQIPGLAPYMAKSIGIECDKYDPMRRLNLSGKRIIPDFAAEHSQEFAIAVGNGLHILFD